MRKTISLLISTTLIMTCIISTPVVFAQDQFDLNVPADVTLIALDDFENNTGDIMVFTAHNDYPQYEVYSGGVGFEGGWMSNVELTQGAPYNPSPSNSNPSFYVDADSQFILRGRSPMYRKLATPIDLDTDAEYYFVYTYTSKNTSDYRNYFAVGNATSQSTLSVGERRRNGPDVYRAPTSSINDWYSTRIMPGDDTTRVTTVLNVSARNGIPNIYRVRAFPHIEGEETPSFTPSYWDMEQRATNNETGRINDIVKLVFTNNTGSTHTYRVDKIAIYKSSPIYVQKVNPNSETNTPHQQVMY